MSRYENTGEVAASGSHVAASVGSRGIAGSGSGAHAIGPASGLAGATLDPQPNRTPSAHARHLPHSCRMMMRRA